MTAELQVKWNRHRYTVEFPTEEFDTVTVKDLKEKCHRFTGIDPANMKLLAYGAMMKDDSKALSAYGLLPGSKIILMGSKHSKDVRDGLRPETQDKLTQLDDLMSRIKQNISPDVDSYEKRVNSFATQTEKDAKDQKKLVDYGIYLVEQLMQTLFDLDGIVCTDGMDALRQKRKEGVKLAQALLDRVDRIKAKAKEL